MSKRIVIIDDEYFFRQALIKYIKGFEPEFAVAGDAGNGVQGIALIEQYRPEIVLVDISMPQMIGFDVISYILDRKLPCRFIIISGYDRFEYAQQAIQMGVQDFLLKPVTVEGLYKSLKKVSDAIDEEAKKEDSRKTLDRQNRSWQNYLRRFAASQFVRQDRSREEMEKLAAGAGYCLDAPHHAAALYRVDHLPEDWESTDYELYYFMVNNVCCELFGQEASCISYINFQRSLCFIIGFEGHGTDFCEWIRGVMSRVIQVCDAEDALETTVCVGSCRPAAEQIYDSYIEAFSLERKAIFYEKKGIHFSQEAVWEEKDIGALQPDEELKQKLLQAMRQNRKGLMEEIIRMFIDSLTVMQLPMEQVTLQVNGMLHLICSFASEYGVSEQVSRNSKLFSSDYRNSSTISEIRDELLHYAGYMLAQVHTVRSSSSVIVRRTKEYIKANYMDSGLCLEQIAGAIDVNLQYMCFLFKKQTDSTIGAYILKTRMEMASRLFQRTGFNVSEVSDKVGFEDVAYFSKCFKKYFGVSPKQYRNTCGNDSQRLP